MSDIAVLFATPRSVYKKIENLEVYDEKRNALNYRGQLPVIAHPPCRFWSRLWGLAKPQRNEYEYAIWAYELVTELGGILEHPYRSRLWKYLGIKPYPINQGDYGHKMKKETGLYCVNCQVNPPLVLVNKNQFKRINLCSKNQAMATTMPFAKLLIRSIRESNELKT